MISDFTSPPPAHSVPESAQPDHWDGIWKALKPFPVDATAELNTSNPIRREFYRQMGDLNGKHVLDVGCGGGELSVLLAKMGATVTALDTSAEALRATAGLAEFNGVSGAITFHHGDFASLPESFRFDLVVGIFVLHHIEPFDGFCRDLRSRMLPGSRGVFLENNARNPLLMFCRKYLVGRFGIPKYGDDSEYPFEPSELELLRRELGSAEVLVPQLIFVRKLNTYLLRHKPIFKPFLWFNERLDDTLFTLAPSLRKYSYNQIITFERTR